MSDGEKPRKPYPSFPLTPRKDGRFAKKIRGVYHAFGSGGNWQAALDEYHRVAKDIHAGRPAPTEAADAVTVKQCANRYLLEREKDAKAGTLKWGTWDDYRDALDRFAAFVGPTLLMAQLQPDDFARFGEHLRAGSQQRKQLGAYAYNRVRASVRAWLKYAKDARWIHEVSVGVGFKKVSAGKMRQQKKARLFTPAQVRKLLATAKPQLRAMILLGANGGLGASDCAALTRDRVDLKAGVIRYPREKTHIPRTVTLWPETVAALRKVMAIRPDDPLVFRTKHGLPWVRETRKGKQIINKDSVAAEFDKLMRAAGMKDGGAMAGVGFYALRHTFNTYANEVRDSDARLHLMGRKLPGIDGDTYLEAIFLPRLKAITDHVRSCLLKSPRRTPGGSRTRSGPASESPAPAAASRRPRKPRSP